RICAPLLHPSFLTAPAPTESSTLSLHDALPISFVPAQDGLPSATELGVPEALLDAVEANPRKTERRQVAALLAAWDSAALGVAGDRKSARLNSSHLGISYAVFCLKKKTRHKRGT